MSRSAFVTGAYGLVGSRLVAALLERDIEVTVLKFDDGVASALELEGTERHVNVVRGDVCDARLIDRILLEFQVESVFHLAAQTIVGVASREPVATFETNIRGTWTVLDACRRHGVGGVVVAASDKAYGAQEQLPYTEDAPLVPRFPYDVSKAATDMIARSYWHTFGLRVAVTRFANVYGGGDLNLSRLVPESVLAAIDGRRPVIRSDGSLQRDFMYVDDAVHAYLGIWSLLDQGGAAGESFNAGGDRPHSVREVVELVCRAAGTGVEPDVRGAGTPAGEIERQWVDSTKLRSACGWTPRVSLEDGIDRTVQWYQDYIDRLGIERRPGASPE
jgi:CDP-glucose 4,6-dehydratase